jgi:hypothetical protein
MGIMPCSRISDYVRRVARADKGGVTDAVRGNPRMGRISRRQVVQGAAVTTAAMTLGAPAVHAQKDRQTLRFAAEADLKVLDPVWTTAYITRNHSYLVYDTLFGTDENLRVKPANGRPGHRVRGRHEV